MSNETEKITRKLRAILSADVKGYSLLMADDEVHTIQTLKAYRQIMSDLIQQHSGRVVDNPGDNLLAEFSSAVSAVECAVEVQKKLKKENARYVEDKRLKFRIGVNIGDVVHDGDRIYGSGVNVAARIEGLSYPGGICISRGTYDQVKGKLELETEYLGEHSVKNIEEPVRVYRVLMSTGAPKPLVEEQLELPDRPSIAVLPFTNMSGDPEQEYFSDGITEDIITALSRSSWMFVIARNSSFTYRGKAVDIKRISKELGVRYVLEGSVRKAGNSIRVTAQLIDGTDGQHIWAEKYDGVLQDIFDLQDRITQKVVASTQTQIQRNFGDNETRISRQNLRTWDVVAKAWKYAYDLNKDSLEKAEDMLKTVLKTDPESSMAHCILATVLSHQVWLGLVVDNAQEVLSDAHHSAEIAISLDDRNEYAHWILGFILLSLRDYDRAVSELERAIEINPNMSLAYGTLGTILSFCGEPEASIHNNETAMRMNPRDPSIFFRYSSIATSHFIAGRYAEAVDWAYKSIHRKPTWRIGHVILISSLAHQGRIKEASKAIDAFLQIAPNTSASNISFLPFKNPEDLLHVKEGLRKAGLPD